MRTTITLNRALTIVALTIGCAASARSQNSTAIATNNPNQAASIPAPIASGPAGRFGAGITLGEPIGASLKYWLCDTLAVDGAIGASFNHSGDHDSSFYLHSDLLWHNFDVFNVSKGRLPVYFGVGGLVRFRDNEDNQVGIRIPVGVSYMFEDVPLDVFVEIAPAIDVAPGVRGEVTGGVGVRFWF
jgi:hypothetical protein